MASGPSELTFFDIKREERKQGHKQSKHKVLLRISRSNQGGFSSSASHMAPRF